MADDGGAPLVAVSGADVSIHGRAPQSPQLSDTSAPRSPATVEPSPVISAPPLAPRYTELQYHRLAASASIYGLCSLGRGRSATDEASNRDGTAGGAASNPRSTPDRPSSQGVPPAVAVALCNQGDEPGSMGNGLVRLVASGGPEASVIPIFEWVMLPGVAPSDSLVSVAGYTAADGGTLLGLTSMQTLSAGTASAGPGGDVTHPRAEFHLFQWGAPPASDPTQFWDTPTRHVHIPLDFIPFCLEEVTLPTGRHGFILSGQNRLFFVAALDLLDRIGDDDADDDGTAAYNSALRDTEMPLPGIPDIPSSATAIKIKTFGSYHVSAVGYQDGCCQLAVTRLGAPTDCDPPLHARVSFDGPVTSLELFELPRHAKAADGLAPTQPPQVQLVVGCALEAAVVYTDVVQHGLQFVTLLPGSNRHDSVLCVRAITANFDGVTEIVVGTYGQTLLGYRCCANSGSQHDGSGSAATLGGGQSGEGEWLPEHRRHAAATEARDATPQLEFRLAWQHRFAHPVYSVEEMDVTADGIAELVILSMFGLHVLQYDFTELDRRACAVIALMRQVDSLEASVKKQVRRGTDLGSCPS